ncbi:MAG: hypothetical protein ACOX47_01360 [Bacillota bacterium]|jgi:hypothetical protein
MGRTKTQGFFRTYGEANRALEKLKNAGFNQAFVDINDSDFDFNVETNLAGTESSNNSLSALVLKSGDSVTGRWKAPLTAASPMVSGMGDFEEIYDSNYKLVVETEEENVPRVKEIIRNKGGDLENPRVGIPKGLENVGLEEVILSNIEEL